MIDQAKRETLKKVAVIGVGSTAIAASPGLLANVASVPTAGALKSSAATNEGLVQIQVGARLASTTNDLEVVITNTGSTGATITSMTPAEINTVRGRFDFNALFNAGELHLAAGESITVPIQHHAVVLDGSPVNVRATELMQSLRRNVSIITNTDSFAATTVASFANLA